jgi:hypothetical protein
MLLPLAFLGLAGCIPVPYHFTLRPEVSGVVLDAASSAPIGNATITCTTPNLSRGTTDQIGKSDPHGQFKIPAKKRWALYIIPEDIYIRPTTVLIVAPGHQTQSRQVDTFRTRGEVVDLGDIRLAETR